MSAGVSVPCDDSAGVVDLHGALVVDPHDHFVDDRSAVCFDPPAERPTNLAGAFVAVEAGEQDLELGVVDAAHVHPAWCSMP